MSDTKPQYFLDYLSEKLPRVDLIEILGTTSEIGPGAVKYFSLADVSFYEPLIMIVKTKQNLTSSEFNT
jgi:hypothetical protein